MTKMCLACGFNNSDEIIECLNCTAPMQPINPNLRKMVLGITGYSRLDDNEIKQVTALVDELISKHKPTEIFTGGGFGVDAVVTRCAMKSHIKYRNFYPNGVNYDHFIERNMSFVTGSDKVIIITKKLFSKPCPHCKDGNHEKNSGCWSLKYATEHGKEGELIVI